MPLKDAENPRVAVAMLGARRHYAVPRALHEAGMLDRFYTDLCASGWAWRALRSAVPPAWRRGGFGRLLARHLPEVPADRIVQFPDLKLKRALLKAHPRKPGERLRAYATYNELFNHRVVACGLGSADTIYVFNAAGREIAEHARRQGLRVVLDQTAAPWEVDEKLLAEERVRWPGWEFEGAREEDWRPLAQRERAEWDLADLIVCGSEYVVDALRSVGGPASKCRVVPHGIETAPSNRMRKDHGGALHVLFAGTLQLRKGIQYVMEAARLCRGRDIVFRAVGPVAVSDGAVRELAAVMEIVGPVPRSAMPREYDWADALVLPSLSEGSAHVTYEALAHGLPVVTTPNAGSVVRHGIEGFVVPIRSADGIAEALARLAENRDLVRDMSRNAVLRAAEYPWPRYARALAAAVAAR